MHPAGTAALVYFCEKGTHRSVAACHQDAWILRAMGFHVRIANICKWHHDKQACQKRRTKCWDCDPDNRRSLDLWEFGVKEFFETVLVADGCSVRVCGDVLVENKRCVPPYVINMPNIYIRIRTYIYIYTYVRIYSLCAYVRILNSLIVMFYILGLSDAVGFSDSRKCVFRSNQTMHVCASCCFA